MIRKQTTIITGAGASVPYGYPTSEKLRDWICQDFVGIYKTLYNSSAGTEALETKIMPLINRYKKCDELYFDMFITRLENEEDRNICYGILKMAIWFYEIFKTNLTPINENWIAYLFNNFITYKVVERIMCEHTNLFEKIRFITFNYDRFLKYKLHSLLLNNFDDRLALIQSINIRLDHVYGRISDLEWEDSGKKIPYQYNGEKHINGKRLSIITSLLEQFTNPISIMHTERGFINRGTKMKIEIAENIYFLGFGFDEENLMALDYLKDFSGKKIYGTALGKSDREIIIIKSRMIELNDQISPDDIILENCNCIELLKKYPLV